jgi:hypothetical protein
MRRELRILLFTLAMAALWAGGSRVPEALASMDTFKIQDVEISGLRYLSRGQVLELMDITSETSIWGDRDRWTQALEEHPLVKSVFLRRRMPGTLVVQVVERRPVALVPTPLLQPVDADGVLLPIDPAEYRLDLPVVTPAEPVAKGARLVPTPTRRLLARVGRLMEGDTTFLQMVSRVSWRGPNTVVARWSEPPVDLLLRADASPARVREGFTVLADAVGREPDRAPLEIDLRYADQVVVRRTDHR